MSATDTRNRLIRDFIYGSHLPVLKAAVSYFSPDFCLELGAGKFSTPFLNQHVKQLVTVENDPDWYDELECWLPERDGFHSILHQVGSGIGPHTVYHEVPPLRRAQHNRFYRFLQQYVRLQANGSLRLLFVDQFVGLRTVSLQMLADDFDLVVFHDTEPASMPSYRYDLFLQTLTPTHWVNFVFRSFNVHTDLLVRRRLFDKWPSLQVELGLGVSQEADEYCRSFAALGNELQLQHRFEYR
jgi:hypothetical protein